MGPSAILHWIKIWGLLHRFPVNSFLFRNGLQFCEVIEQESTLRPDASGTLFFVTTQRVIQMPGDVFELVTPEVKFPVTIRRCQIVPQGWATVCELGSGNSNGGDQLNQ